MALLPAAAPARGAIMLTNGGFETTGASYGSFSVGELFEAAGWVNLSGNPIQASSEATGFSFAEGVPNTFMTGSRFLRFASDLGAQGIIAQNLGTMVAGETYPVTANLFGGTGQGLTFVPSALLASDPSLTPTTTYASQTAGQVVPGATSIGGFNFSYSATAADDGQSLYLVFAVNPSFPGTSVRGGIDDVALTVTAAPVPEPASLMTAAGAAALGAIAWRRRRRA
jgi:hypothetical protein